jgi:hypothetical protein
MNKLKDLIESNPAFSELMRAKSSAIIEADALKARGERAKALALYAEAARIEYLLSEFLSEEGLHADAMVSLLSCASCWYCADELHAARSVAREAVPLCGPKDRRIRARFLALLKKIEAALPPARPAGAATAMEAREGARSSR